MSQTIDEHGKAVIEFTGNLKNASRAAVYADTIVDIFNSDHWRDYSTAAGHDRWLECEFDYFLIANGARYSDVQLILSWSKVKTADVARAMDKDANSRRRRPLDQASAEWDSGQRLGTSLTRLAEANGWVGKSGRLLRPPVSERAVAQAKHGVTMDEHARQQREQRLPASRRRELDKLAGDVLAQLVNDDDRRYLVDRLRKPRGRPATSAAELAQWRADADKLDWNAKALAEHWSITEIGARKRLRRMR
jgi:hypothetical protein